MQVLAKSSLYVSDADQDPRGWLNPKGFKVPYVPLFLL